MQVEAASSKVHAVKSDSELEWIQTFKQFVHASNSFVLLNRTKLYMFIANKQTNVTIKQTKPPVKKLVMNTYTLENVINEQIVIPSANVHSNTAFILIGCANSSLLVDSKCKNVMMEHC